MIIMDYSQVAMAAIFQFSDDLKNPSEDVENLVRHAILSSIKKIKREHKKYANEVVIACDGSSIWRRDKFPQYKANRKKNRDKSDLPWDDIYRVMGEVREELDKFFPYKVVRHERAEGDDVIAVIIEEIVNKRVVQNGVMEEIEPVLAISSDRDLMQLSKYSNYRQYSNIQEKFVTIDRPVKEFLREKIIRGDSGDGVCNVFSPSNSLADGIRQKQCKATLVEEMIKSDNFFESHPDPDVRRRLKENAEMISFTAIPVNIRREIVDLYEKANVAPRLKIFEYLTDKKCKLLIDDIDQF